MKHYKNHSKFVILVCLSLFAAGCATSKGSAGIKVEGVGDSLEPKIKVTTYDYYRPMVVEDSSQRQDWWLRGYVDKETKQVQSQIYVRIIANEWKYWDIAKFHNGNKLVDLPITKVGSDVNCTKYGCEHIEDVVIVVSEDELKSWSKSNIVIRIASSKVEGKRDITVKPNEVSDYLDKINYARATLK